jgi:hypothetical protein
MQADSLRVVLTFENQQFYGNHDYIFCRPEGTNIGLFLGRGRMAVVSPAQYILINSFFKFQSEFFCVYKIMIL